MEEDLKLDQAVPTLNHLQRQKKKSQSQSQFTKKKHC